MKPQWTIRSTAQLSGSWEGPDLEASPPQTAWDGPPWTLFLGEDERALHGSVTVWFSGRKGELLLPPDGVPLALAVRHLEPPPPSGLPRFVVLYRMDCVFYNTLRSGAFALTGPLYLLPKIAQTAARDRRVGVIATAIPEELERRAPEVLLGRGLASRFTTYRLSGSGRARGGRPSPTSVPAWSRLEAGLETRDPSVREKAYRDAVTHSPEDPLTHLCLGSALAEQGRLGEAVAALRRSLELEPDLDAAHYELAKLLIRTDDMPGAIEGFRRTTELLPEFSSAWTNLGAALGETEDLEGAARALERAVGLDPLSHALRSNLGVTLRNLGRYDEAEAEFEKALELSPDFVFGHYNLAYNLYLQGRYPEAISRFEKALDMDSEKTPRQALLLAATRLASGDREGANRDYRAVLTALEGQPRTDMITVASWDLEQLQRARRFTGEEPAIAKTLALVKSLG